MNLDIEDRLMDYIESISLVFPTYKDINASDESISLTSMPGSRVIRSDYGGYEEKQFNYVVQLKVRGKNREKGADEMMKLAFALDDLEELPSSNESYEFNDITIANELYFSQADTNSFVYFRLQFNAILTVNRGNN